MRHYNDTAKTINLDLPSHDTTEKEGGGQIHRQYRDASKRALTKGASKLVGRDGEREREREKEREKSAKARKTKHNQQETEKRP